MCNELQGKVMDEAVTAVRHYLDMVVDAPLKAVGGMLGDQVNYWRFKNKINIVLKAKRFIEQKNINPGKLLPDIFVPLIEEAGNTEIDEIQDMFASLLVSHLDPATQTKVHPCYSKTLAQLAPLDALIIGNLYDALKHNKADPAKSGLTIEMVQSWAKTPADLILLSFQNLWRLGICDHGPDPLDLLNNKKAIRFTEFGWAFISACKRLNHN